MEIAKNVENLPDALTKPVGNRSLPPCELCANLGKQTPAPFIVDRIAMCRAHWEGFLGQAIKRVDAD